MSNELFYFFTIYGEVYTGEIMDEPLFSDYVILIQRTRLEAYLKLKNSQKKLQIIPAYGWALHNKIITGCLRLNIDDYLNQRYKRQAKEWYGNFDRRTMFIFGAGASANCATGSLKKSFLESGSRPPCGPQLFEKRFERFYQKYPGVIHSLHKLQGEGAIDVEALFEDDWQEIQQYGNSQVISRHINIQYYLQELLQHISFSTLTGYGTGVLATIYPGQRGRYVPPGNVHIYQINDSATRHDII
ncbi:MAG: hypothetical protein WDO71_19215 [Bacteroidota bacterium]